MLKPRRVKQTIGLKDRLASFAKTLRNEATQLPAGRLPNIRACIFALAAIISAFDRAGAADGTPAFDIAKNCREEVVGSIGTERIVEEILHRRSLHRRR